MASREIGRSILHRTKKAVIQAKQQKSEILKEDNKHTLIVLLKDADEETPSIVWPIYFSLLKLCRLEKRLFD